MHLRAIPILISILSLVISATEIKAIESDLGIATKWSGDFDGMADRHLIRALVPPSKTFYFLDGADQRGLTYELLKEFEAFVNTELQRKALKIKLVVIPTRRDQLVPALVKGKIDGRRFDPACLARCQLIPQILTGEDFAQMECVGYEHPSLISESLTDASDEFFIVAECHGDFGTVHVAGRDDVDKGLLFVDGIAEALRDEVS